MSTMTSSSSSPELPRCDTELSLRLDLAPAPSRCCHATTGELKQKQAAVATPCWCGGGGEGLAATELQAMAILRVARRAAAAEEGASCDGAAGLSMRRSMEWFLQRRREGRRQRGADADSAAAASPSSSSFSCLTDSSRI